MVLKAVFTMMFATSNSEVLSKVAGAAKRAAELGFGEYIRQVRC